MIRLAVRVRREQAELVLAELLELVPGGVEEVEVGEGTIEYAVYGAPGELPSLPDLNVAVGDALTLRGHGMPSLGRGRRGDLRVVVNVVIPRRLSEEQRELLEQLKATLTPENLRSDESMFAKLRRALGSQAA